HPPGPARDLRRPDGRRRVHQSWRAVAIQGAGADPRRRGGDRRPDRLPVLQVLNDTTGWAHVVLITGLGTPDRCRERSERQDGAYRGYQRPGEGWSELGFH